MGKVCIVLVEDLEELRSWLKNPTEAADLLKEAQQILEKVEDDLTSMENVCARSMQIEREEINAAMQKLDDRSKNLARRERCMDDFRGKVRSKRVDLDGTASLRVLSPGDVSGLKDKLVALETLQQDAKAHFTVRSTEPSAPSSHFRLEQLGASVEAAVAAEPRIADEVRTEHVTVQTAAAQIELSSARIVNLTRCGAYYVIEIHSADQQDIDFAPMRLMKRYSEFAALDTKLRPRHLVLPTLPEKSVFFRRTFSACFMDDREKRLGAYLSALVANPAVVAEPSVQLFLGMWPHMHKDIVATREQFREWLLHPVTAPMTENIGKQGQGR